MKNIIRFILCLFYLFICSPAMAVFEVIPTTPGSGVPGSEGFNRVNRNFAKTPNEVGKAGGDTIAGGTGAGESLTLDSTADATKGDIALNPGGGTVTIGTLTPKVGMLNINNLMPGNAIYIKEGGKEFSLGGGGWEFNDTSWINPISGSATRFFGDIGLGVDPTAPVDIVGSTPFETALRIRPGLSPNVPVEGDIWFDSLGLNVFYDGHKKHLSPQTLIYVHSLDDFPAAVGGYIPLESYEYVIAKELLIDGTAGIYGFDIPTDESPTITGLGSIRYEKQSPFTDALFRSADLGTGLVLLNNLNIISDGTGRLFNIASPSSKDGFIVIQTFSAGGMASLGKISDTSFFGFVVNLPQSGVFGGLTLENNNSVVIQSFRFYNWLAPYSQTFLTLQGAHGEIQINNNFFSPYIDGEEPDPTAQHVLYIDPLLTTTGGTVTGCAFQNPDLAFQDGSKRQDDIFWTYAGNAGLADSTVTLQGTFTSVLPSTTTLPAQFAKMILTAPNWAFVDTERATGGIDGSSNYDGRETVTLDVTGNVELNPNGINKDIRTQFILVKPTDYEAAFDNITNRVIDVSDLAQDDDTISFSDTGGTLPAALFEGAIYYVINKTTGFFQVSYTQGGLAIPFGDDGTPTNSYRQVFPLGGIGRGQLSDTAQLIPQALIGMDTDNEIKIIVWNDSTPVTSVSTTYAYYKLRK